MSTYTEEHVGGADHLDGEQITSELLRENQWLIAQNKMLWRTADGLFLTIIAIVIAIVIAVILTP